MRIFRLFHHDVGGTRCRPLSSLWLLAVVESMCFPAIQSMVFQVFQVFRGVSCFFIGKPTRVSVSDIVFSMLFQSTLIVTRTTPASKIPASPEAERELKGNWKLSTIATIAPVSSTTQRHPSSSAKIMPQKESVSWNGGSQSSKSCYALNCGTVFFPDAIAEIHPRH